MKNNFKIYLLVWAIGLAMFNIVAFLVPSDDKFNSNFILGYSFITLAYILQLGIGYFAFKESNKSKVFLGLPTVTMGFVMLVLIVIASVVTMAIESIPEWLGAIICFLCFAIGAIAVLGAKAAGDIVGAKDDKIKAQTFFIKAMTIDLDTLCNQATDPEVKNEVKKVYEAVRYSDPMSADALASCESQISVKFNQLSDAVLRSDLQMVRSHAEEMIILVNDRNNKCKLLK